MWKLPKLAEVLRLARMLMFKDKITEYDSLTEYSTKVTTMITQRASTINITDPQPSIPSDPDSQPLTLSQLNDKAHRQGQ
ncbi:hypothetical protein M514_00207 [Trichuris suis]|uniref:Uncharacterized protein n=1 Tax=Trichuris suis TaxID=68888 RepID=A0A085MP98_9BILA|nr:hypothetical protein M513_00207 [Trichuris suis]KFD73085.1 hypothetical protein M514_00207 [Trichuris suis]